jgi:hypothetical protein
MERETLESTDIQDSFIPCFCLRPNLTDMRWDRQHKRRLFKKSWAGVQVYYND